MSEEIKNETNVSEPTTETNVTVNAPEKKDADSNVSVEQRLQDALVEIAKLKRASDKNASEAAEFKKKWKASLSEQEAASMEKAEKEAAKDEELAMLRRENQINKYAKGFLALGYNEAQANQAATAQYDGDTDTLFKIQSSVQDSIIKAKEAEWLKSRPQVNVGAAGEQTTVTQEQFDKMGYLELNEFQKKFPETYKQYIKS